MSKGKILVVEDSPTKRKFLKELLAQAGYDVKEAQDGEDGLAKVAQDIPDVIIADLSMPKIDGFEMVKRLKSDEKTKYTPVICVSATYKDLSDKLRMLVDVGAEEYFYAPENTEELLAKVVVMMRVRNIYLSLLEKNKELKIFNDAAVGRELKMVELKNKIKELEAELGKRKK